MTFRHRQVLSLLGDGDVTELAQDLDIKLIAKRFFLDDRGEEAFARQRKIVYEGVAYCMSAGVGKGPALGGAVRLCNALSQSPLRLGMASTILDESSVYITLGASNPVSFAPEALAALDVAEACVNDNYKNTLLEPLHNFPVNGGAIREDFAKRVHANNIALKWLGEVRASMASLSAVSPKNRETLVNAITVVSDYLDMYAAATAANYRAAVIGDLPTESEEFIRAETVAMKHISITAFALWMQSMAFLVNGTGDKDQLTSLHPVFASWDDLLKRASSPSMLLKELGNGRIARIFFFQLRIGQVSLASVFVGTSVP